jgi:hypothetical protein
MSDQTLSLDQLLQLYAQAESAAREQAGPLLTQLEALQKQVFDLTVRIRAIRQPHEDRQAALYEQIKPLAEAELKDAKKKNKPFPGGKVKYRRGYTKHNWNTDKLLGYAEAHPEIKAFDTPTPVAALVTIELD